jgi:hypothetical protein
MAWRAPLWTRVLTAFVLSVIIAFPQESTQTETVSGRPELTTEDVRRFIDPTLMISAVDYSFQANYLPQDIELFTHRIAPFWAVNDRTGFWADIPIRKFSIPNAPGPSGIGDTRLGWGAVLREDLEHRFTTGVFWMEALAPTGNPEKGTGFGTWVLAPGAGVALNPSDKFPVFITGNYLHSIEGLRGKLTEVEEELIDDLRVRSIELNIETLHVLPKGFYLAALPSFTFNLNQSFNLFTLGLGIGRALSRRVAISGGYVHYVAGQREINQAFTIGLSFLVGPDQEMERGKSR